MRHNTRHLIFETLYKLGKYDCGEVLLEFLGHIISDLADSVKRGISDLWVGVVAVLNNNRNHDLDLLRIVHILTDLTESHDAGVFIAPIRIIGDSVHDQSADEREHFLLAD